VSDITIGDWVIPNSSVTIPMWITIDETTVVVFRLDDPVEGRLAPVE
jgi:hypothetical protein